MVQNIAIIGLDRDISREVASLVANELEMHFMDTIDLFEFDNKPRDLSEMLKVFGVRHFRKKEKGTIKYVSSFNQTVINFESGSASCKENLKTIKENCLIVYLKKRKPSLIRDLKKKNYASVYLKRFYLLTDNAIKRRNDNLVKYADIVINVDNQSVFKITSELIRQIKAFYGVV